MRAPSHSYTLFALLVMVCAVGTPTEVRCAPPSVINGTFPTCVRLVASDGAQAARAFGEFEVVVRDLANNPVPGAVIRVDFSVIPELHIAADQHDPDAIVDCGGKSVSKIADVNGRAVFCIVGSNIPGAAAVTLLGGCRIFANGILGAFPTAIAFDLDGMGGVDGGDLSVFLTDFFSGQSFGRSDYDCDGNLGGGDLSYWLAAFGSGTQLVSAAGCP